MDKEISDLKNAHGDELRLVATKYEALEAQYQDLKDDVDLIAAEAEVRTKGAMAELYRQHHPDGPWVVEPFILDAQEVKRLNRVSG